MCYTKEGLSRDKKSNKLYTLLCNLKIKKRSIGFWIMIISLISMLVALLVIDNKQVFALSYIPLVIGLMFYRH